MVTAIRVTAIVVVLLASVPVHADPDGPEVSAARESARFAKLVDAGDRARRTHQYSAAVARYNEAFAIRPDPAVGGRMGLVLLEIGEHAGAAEQLLRAITMAQAPVALMQQFHAAFARVRPKVCFVEVSVSEAGADISLDGDQETPTNNNAFHVFVTAGPHEFRAKLDGFENAVESFDGPAGGELQVRLELKPLPPPPKKEELKPNPDPMPPVVGKPPNRLSDSYAHFSLGAGGVLVLGATPGVAVGPQISGGVRWKFVSVGVDARVAWGAGTLETAPDLRFVTWAAGVRPCAHYRFLFGCGLVQVSGMKSLSEGDRWQTRFGGGLRGGVEFVLRKPVQLQLWGEGVVLSNGYRLIQNGRGVWYGLPVLGGFGVTTFLTW